MGWQLLVFEEVKKEIEKEKTLQKWARRVWNHLPRKTKRVIFEMTDNMVWSGDEKEVLPNGAKETRCLMKSPTRS